MNRQRRDPAHSGRGAAWRAKGCRSTGRLSAAAPRPLRHGPASGCAYRPAIRAAGQPFVLAPWQIAIIDDALTRPETLACMARKNAKSATVAVLALAFLVGPLRRAGWRCGVLSVNRGKAGEFRQQIEDIAIASGFRCALPGNRILSPDLTFRATPWPGRVIGDNGSRVEIEGAGHASASGHSAGYDLAVIDEIGIVAGTAQGRRRRYAFVRLG